VFKLDEHLSPCKLYAEKAVEVLKARARVFIYLEPEIEVGN
jgi:hypothetical protein